MQEILDDSQARQNRDIDDKIESMKRIDGIKQKGDMEAYFSEKSRVIQEDMSRSMTQQIALAAKDINNNIADLANQNMSRMNQSNIDIGETSNNTRAWVEQEVKNMNQRINANAGISEAAYHNKMNEFDLKLREIS